MTNKTIKQVTIFIHPELKQILRHTNTKEWITTQIKQYQPNLKIPPIPNYTKTRYKPKLPIELLDQLQQIPGRTTSQKITNLYFNQLQREYHKEQRIKILKKLFPNNKYV